MSVVAEKKQREFLNKKKKFLSEVNSTKISPLRALSPTSESIQYRLSRIGFQKPTQELNRYDYPPVVYDEEKGVVIGKKPCARDGHACFVIDNNMHILGGDRHMVSFNDCHIFRMDKALESVIHYSIWSFMKIYNCTLNLSNCLFPTLLHLLAVETLIEIASYY